jgi:hypothetical protein
MRLLPARLRAAWGFRDPVEIPRGGVTCDEVRQTLESRLDSRYTVTAGSKSDLVTIQVQPKRSEHDHNHRSAIVEVVRCDHRTNIKVQPVSRGVGRDVRRFRRLLRSAPELRVGKMTTIKQTADKQDELPDSKQDELPDSKQDELPDSKQDELPDSKQDELPDSLVSLLSVYAGQFGSYTTLLWQVPALGLTAQAFLLTIALMKDSSSGDRVVACVLSMIIAIASVRLMHNQRGRAINHAELLRRLSEKLELSKFLGGGLELGDATPSKTDAQNIWAVDHLIYHGWSLCMYLFMLADLLIILAVILRPSLFG